MCVLLLPLLLAHNTQKCEMIEIVLEYVCFFSLLLLLRMFDMRVNKKNHTAKMKPKRTHQMYSL